MKLLIADMVHKGQSQHPMTMNFISTVRLFLTCSSASNGAEKYVLYIVTETNLPMYHQDCASAPYTDDDHSYPSPLLGYEDLMAYFYKQFGFTPREVKMICVY